jgi:hypothetical protein
MVIIKVTGTAYVSQVKVKDRTLVGISISNAASNIVTISSPNDYRLERVSYNVNSGSAVGGYGGLMVKVREATSTLYAALVNVYGKTLVLNSPYMVDGNFEPDLLLQKEVVLDVSADQTTGVPDNCYCCLVIDETPYIPDLDSDLLTASNVSVDIQPVKTCDWLGRLLGTCT